MRCEDREYYKTIRRLALASFAVRNGIDADDLISDIDLHADNDWARAEAMYKELMKIDKERSNEADVSSNN